MTLEKRIRALETRWTADRVILHLPDGSKRDCRARATSCWAFLLPHIEAQIELPCSRNNSNRSVTLWVRRSRAEATWLSWCRSCWLHLKRRVHQNWQPNTIDAKVVLSPDLLKPLSTRLPDRSCACI